MKNIFLKSVCLIACLSLGLFVQAQDAPLPLGAVPSEEAQDFYEVAFGLFMVDLSCESVGATRLGLGLLSALVSTPDAVTIEDFEIEGIPTRWFTPPNAQAERVLYYLHGGGYIAGSIEGVYESHIARLALHTGLRVLAIDYRLAPENPYPAALEDSLTAYRWLRDQGEENIIISGDSAGGNLAMSTLVALRDAGDPLPDATVLFSPWVDLANTGTSHMLVAEADPILTTDGLTSAATCYATDIPLDDPRLSPLYADLSGLPPMLIQVGTYEILLSDSTRLAQAARAAGIDVQLSVWEGQVHDWMVFNDTMPESQAAYEVVRAFVNNNR